MSRRERDETVDEPLAEPAPESADGSDAAPPSADAPDATPEPGTGSDSAADDTEAVGLAAVEPSPEQRIAELTRELDDTRDRLLRRTAEFDNYRKRVHRDREQWRLDAIGGFLEGLVPALDDLDRAVGVDVDDRTLREGIELIRRAVRVALEREGVQILDPAGEAFDPERHQALTYEPAPGQPDGTIVEVFRKGYLLRDRLVRPAMVKVAKAEPPPGGDDPGTVH